MGEFGHTFNIHQHHLINFPKNGCIYMFGCFNLQNIQDTIKNVVGMPTCTIFIFYCWRSFECNGETS